MLSSLTKLLDIALQVFKIFLYLLPFILPILAGFAFFSLWMRFVRTKYITSQDYILLEIKISKEILKSPLAMEIFLTSLWQSGAATYTDTYLSGKVKPWFSLELVSLEGQVRFFIWAQARYRKMIETQIYAQYPNVEIYEAEDYTTNVKHNPEEILMWGTYFKLTGKDVYPIKTYIDYGLEKPGSEEEEKVDPFSSVIEYLGSMRKGEQVWIQILIQAHRKEWIREGRLFKKTDWKNEAKEELEKLRKESMLKIEGSPFKGFPSLTKMQEQKINSIERSLHNYAFDSMIRGFYIAKKEAFNPVGIVGLIGSVRQYNSNSLNGLKLGWFTDHSDNMKDWIKILGFIPGLKTKMEQKRSQMEKSMLEAYKMRSFFQPPYKNHNGKPFILTTEELATIYHFPGEVSTTPTLSRITSKKSKPPANLPI